MKIAMPVTIGASENSFDNPIGLLSDCHRRIERFLQALLTVATRAAGGPLDAEHRSALEAALKYFREAAPKHTADEEEDLFPALKQVGGQRVSAVLAGVDRLEAEHKKADVWHREVEEICERWLREDHLASEEAAHLAELLGSLSDLYRQHIALEDQEIFPVAQAELSAAAKQAIGRRMAARRGALFIAGSIAQIRLKP
jgi:hemerythrin-like domain-containing protein